jgi:small redox-active disulfide protein 2
MKIEILGMGCVKCNALEQQVREALKEMNIDGELTKVSDLDRISSYGVLMTPGLVINGKVYSSGKLPAMATLKGWIEKEADR